MELKLSAGEVAAKRAKPSGEDRLSALHDDVLVLILLRLDTAAAAGRTSVLARRWRRVWTFLPGLCFPAFADPNLVASALNAHEAPLRYLLVQTLDAAPESVATWIRAAAPRLSGCLIFQNRLPERHDGEEERGSVQFPCLENATTVSLDLGFLGFTMPPASVFARLTELTLSNVRFNVQCELGEAVSSPRCPCLQKLIVYKATGLANVTINSESLLRVELQYLNGLGQLTVLAPALKELTLVHCFFRRQGQPVANICAPQLVVLEVWDKYNPSFFQLGNLAQLQQLIGCYFVYVPHSLSLNRGFLRLFEWIKVIQTLKIMLFYPKDIADLQYKMEVLTTLPLVTLLHLSVISQGHIFGSSIFHVLRICNSIRRLSVKLETISEAQYTCPPGCICDQPTNWKTDEITLNCLREVDILDIKGADHEVTFLKRLLSWAAVLQVLRITVHRLVSESKVRELWQTLSSFCRPETRVQVSMYRNAGKELY